MMKSSDIKKVVKEAYGEIAKGSGSCCGSLNLCCGSNVSPETISIKIGYSREDLNTVPQDANLGLGCGNPLAFTSLKEGDVVLDLGSGAGFDCFIAARKVGKTGRVIGIDMTREMIERARENAKKGGFDNVEFRLGEIENLPLPDNYVDVIISNCVINLIPDKRSAFGEAFRVLKPKGRIIISDIVFLGDLPEVIKHSIDAYVGCISGAIKKSEYINLMEEVGFRQIAIHDETRFFTECLINEVFVNRLQHNLGMSINNLNEILGLVVSIKVSAIKPI
ncbi:MAG: arsenite methyltransferase [Deltaproteobacteria bacterium]|nr:arsenite methyltransferase [Deltaproteobacteria bacterium]